MALIPSADEATLAKLAPALDAVETHMGFLPRSMLTMAHWPELLGAFSGLGSTVLAGGELSREVKQLIAFVTSNAAGCRYCQAHTAHGAENAGVSPAKIQAAFEFETSDLFDNAERAALRVAAHGGMAPNAVTPDHMAALREHFSDRQCIEIVAVIALFGFLNRWNDTLATQLEDKPRAFAEETLATGGWQVGKHG